MANWGYLEQVMVAQGYIDPRRVSTDVQNLNRTPIGKFLANVDIDYATFKLKVAGTIPVVINGNTYNIPLALYIDQQHPYKPPKAVVEPAPGMSLNPGPGVRHDGQVIHTYFDNWTVSSSLQHLCENLAVMFGVTSPVTAGTASTPRTSQPTAARPAQPAPQTYQAAGQGYGGGSGGGSYYQPPQQQRGSSGYYQQPAATGYGAGGGVTGYGTGGGYGGAGAAATTTGAGAAAATWTPAPARPEKQEPSRVKSMEDPKIQEAIRASIHEPVVRKVEAKLKPRHRRAKEAIEAAGERRTELTRRAAQLDELMKRGQADLDQVRRANQWYAAELPQVEMQVREFEEHAADLDSPDKVVVATAPLYDQYARLHANYSAIEDTLLLLKQQHESTTPLDDESLKAILTQISALSRTQFKSLFLLQRVKKAAMIP